MVEGSLLMEATRPGLLVIFDPVPGAVVFDSHRLNLAQIVTRRVLPQSGSLLVHGRRPDGPSVVALYDLVTGEQRWTDRKSTRLNSSHGYISYAAFCLKKKTLTAHLTARL